MRFPVYIGLRRSVFLCALLLASCAGSAFSVMLMPWPAAVRAVLLLGVFLLLRRSIQEEEIAALCLKSRTAALDCQWRDGRHRTLTVLPDSTVFPKLIVLRLRDDEEDETIDLSLLPDQMTVDQFRVLSVWLRWQLSTRTPS